MKKSLTIKNASHIAIMKEAGASLASIFKRLEPMIKEGTTPKDVDFFIEKCMMEVGLKPSCKNYQGTYPFVSCISVNDVAVHGIPGEVPFKQGDIVKVDSVGSLQGLHVDMARTFIVGEGSDVAKKLKACAEESLVCALAVIRPGAYISDIAKAVSGCIEKHGFYPIKEFMGHGIGWEMHEEPGIPNYLHPYFKDVMIREGMALAVEPMIFEYEDSAYVDVDGWTARSKNGALSSHYEDTIVVTRDGCEVVTV